MSQGIHTRPSLRPLTLVAAFLLASAALLSSAPAAHAHDELLGSDPAADSTVDALPAQISFTFSGAISAEDGASEVSVTDAAGTELAEGAPSAQDNVLTQQLAGAASGDLTVLWKTVSSDGHPISGEFSFTVSGTPTPTQSTTPEPTQTTEPTRTPSPSATTTPAGGDSAFGEAWPWVIGGLVLVGLGGAVVYLLVSRARREKELAENRERALGGTGGTGSEPPAAH